MADTTKDQGTRFPQTSADDKKPVDTQPTGPKAVGDNPYEFSEEEQRLFTNYDLSTPISRAWSRMRRSGIDVGAPLSPVNENDGTQKQQFQYAHATFNPKDNRNLTVQFNDARGVLGTESGL